MFGYFLVAYESTTTSTINSRTTSSGSTNFPMSSSKELFVKPMLFIYPY